MKRQKFFERAGAGLRLTEPCLYYIIPPSRTRKTYLLSLSLSLLSLEILSLSLSLSLSEIVSLSHSLSLSKEVFACLP